jgi:streptogramin lyase
MNTRRVRIAALMALAVAVAGAAEAHGSATRRTVRPTAGTVVARIPIPSNSGDLAAGEGAVWATSDTVPVLMRIDPATNTVVARTPIASKNACTDLPGSCGEAAAGNGALWIARKFDDSVLRIDPHGGSLAATIPVDPEPEGIATTPGAVWVVDRGRPTVTHFDPVVDRIDPATNTVVATVRIGPAPCCSDNMSVAAAAGAV